MDGSSGCDKVSWSNKSSSSSLSSSLSVDDVSFVLGTIFLWNTSRRPPFPETNGKFFQSSLLLLLMIVEVVEAEEEEVVAVVPVSLGEMDRFR